MIANFIQSINREEWEKNSDDRTLAIVNAISTLLQKLFLLRSPGASSVLERCSSFVSKEKSARSKFMSKHKKVNSWFIIFSTLSALFQSPQIITIVFVLYRYPIMVIILLHKSYIPTRSVIFAAKYYGVSVRKVFNALVIMYWITDLS